jgi:hypothetical protein
MPYDLRMLKKTTDTRSKITVRIWTPILDALNERTEAACLRRDALINQTLAVELPRIREDIPFRNSAKARRYISARLKSLLSSGDDSRQISLSLSPAVAAELESVCEGLNVPRETLLNRALLLLGASGDFMDEHFYNLTPSPITTTGFEPTIEPEDILPWTYPLKTITAKGGGARNHDVRTLAADLAKFDAAADDYDLALSPLGRLAAIAADPLRWYRIMLELRCEQDNSMLRNSKNPPSEEVIAANQYIYTPFGMPFEEDEMEGLNCYVDDEWLSRQAKFKSSERSKPKTISKPSTESRTPEQQGSDK